MLTLGTQRDLVFDYLCHSAFTETARAFVRDSAVKHIDADGDEMMSAEALGHSDLLAETMDDNLAQAEVRREIRVNILSGRVDDAISLLRTHFPDVLNPDANAYTTAQTPEAKTAFKYIPSTSVDPTHLHLNLNILGFIESARTVPLLYHHPGTRVSLSPPPLPSMPLNKERASDDKECSEQQLILLHKAQKLYCQAGSLPKADDRALYLKELSQVTALLAYTDPENSIMATYLSQERREAVADQIEGAILCRTGQEAISRIELASRDTTVIWAELNERNHHLPPPQKWPVGIRPPVHFAPVPRQEASTLGGDGAGSTKTAPDSSGSQAAPPFDLTEFLDSK
ncbi:hypothetical protein PHLGIDRAFT_11928 [Phlebiopsis gigantea 11061_1 CR5-6]|uniref:CRA domain-containing protein n=1 Tax=Phlebiopsis gigantea (strain 11061_1 CR5-6) TaxID=745531 RepID=A0A0C3SAV8_PHLG1|nr:hypothetical protein PHLGIDRAFT_11928 [Phlebiopsis gigantea 11061_1 CR5-6]